MATAETMGPFDPGKAAAWIARGRPPAEAAQLAAIWRRYPDLPAGASADARMRRLRERVGAMRPLNDAIARRNAQDREHRNFAFTATRLAAGQGDDRDRAILAGRDIHGFAWMAAVRYADGLQAARSGWPYAPHAVGTERDAYDRGFREGGGDRDDLFDTARRALRVAEPQREPVPALSSRPLPSTWPKPDDARRPAPWSRRLVIFGAAEAGLAARTSNSAVLLPPLLVREGADAAAVLVVVGDALCALDDARAAATCPPPPADLNTLFAGRDFSDILVAAQGEDLAVIDAHALFLPLARHQERLRHTLPLQRAQFALWLERGLCPGETRAAGHIRWGKTIHGLVARLGELTATWSGKDAQGHRIVITVTATGEPARGYVAGDGAALEPVFHVSNRKAVRGAMTHALRRFAGGIRLAPHHSYKREEADMELNSSTPAPIGRVHHRPLAGAGANSLASQARARHATPNGTRT
ncbi:hypothetical protein [Novosphingobium sp. UBA1939]|uniref:hypothetical protein n=1 Tax=Novosphingobium sp. UBA1939 TaxID=1946982 RepID=UPI0025CF5171|nr:hypothetical protein [Novosphingobium sp. UBA1939]